MSLPVVGYAGLTHLGLNSAAAAAARGFEVIGFHLDEQIVERLNNDEFHVLEPELPEYVKRHRSNLTFTSNAARLAECDVVYVAVDVPTDDNGESDLTPIHEMIGIANTAMRTDAILVILCQVPPGFTRTLNRPAETLYYQVETLIFGRAIERAMFPERYIVGCDDPKQPIAKPLLDFLKAFECPVLPMRLESAELAKISINMCLVASVSVANTMAEICENVGADWSEIVPSLRLDKRIGQFSYINPGLGISGGNLERDLATVLSLAKTHDTDGGVVSSWIANSAHRKNWAYKKLKAQVLDQDPNAQIAVLGLAYKENTYSTKNSPSLALLDNLHNHNVSVFDPVVSGAEADGPFTQSASAEDAIWNADVLLIMTPWLEFGNLKPKEIAEQMRGNVVIDPYRMLDSDAVIAAGLNYNTLGMPPISASV